MGGNTAAVLGALTAANVQFVVVGELTRAGSLQGHGEGSLGPDEAPSGAADEGPLAAHDVPLRLVVSRHPTNLAALSKALDRLGATLATVLAPDAAGHEVPQPIAGPLATVTVTTAGGAVEMMFGGPSSSLYAETLAAAESREIGGVTVRWALAPIVVAPTFQGTARKVARRLMSLAGNLAHIMERRDGNAEADDPGEGPPPADNDQRPEAAPD